MNSMPLHMTVFKITVQLTQCILHHLFKMNSLKFSYSVLKLPNIISKAEKQFKK